MWRLYFSKRGYFISRNTIAAAFTMKLLVLSFAPPETWRNELQTKKLEEIYEQKLANLDELSTTLNQILTERKNKVETSIDNLYAASNKLDGLTNKVDKSLTSVQNLLDKIENQEGAVGKVIMSDSLYNDFRHLTNELETLVQDLKKRPQKYLNLGFIKVF